MTTLEELSAAIDRLEYLALARAENANDRNDARSAAERAHAAIDALPGLIEMGRDYAKLNEPDGVLLNMMRGTIPKVSANSLHKLYTEDELINAARNVFSARIADHDAALKGT
jgi:hypothetical protein